MPVCVCAVYASVSVCCVCQCVYYDWCIIAGVCRPSAEAGVTLCSCLGHFRRHAVHTRSVVPFTFSLFFSNVSFLYGLWLINDEEKKDKPLSVVAILLSSARPRDTEPYCNYFYVMTHSCSCCHCLIDPVTLNRTVTKLLRCRQGRE